MSVCSYIISKARDLIFIDSIYSSPHGTTGCSGKIVFYFTIHCIAVRDLLGSQRNACVQSLLLAGNFL